MLFERKWDSSCPKVFKTWESKGVKWIIQDLDPQDDDEARQMIMENMFAEEVLATLSKVKDDPVGIEEAKEGWGKLLRLRTSIACYAEVDGKRRLAAANCCIVDHKGEKFTDSEKAKGKSTKNVHGALDYIGRQMDVYKHYGVDKLLYGMGLVVRKEYRGAGLATEILASREPLCAELGVDATSTVFTGTASQKSAARAGFDDLVTVTMTQLADAGLDYPRDDRVVKVMGKKYTKNVYKYMKM